MSSNGLSWRDQAWDALPTGVEVEFEGEWIFLNVRAAGAELGVRLIRNFSGAELETCLAVGFECALYFEAGLAMSPNGKDLQLTQWLPGASGWRDASEPLARLLRHADLLRSHVQPFDHALDPACIQGDAASIFHDRAELRFRNMLLR